jgi:hypothetical protein
MVRRRPVGTVYRRGAKGAGHPHSAPSRATPSARGRATVEISEAAAEESAGMGMELLRSAPRSGPDPVPEPALPGEGAVKASTTPTAGRLTWSWGQVGQQQLTWWWIMSRSPPRSRREMPSVAEPRRRRRRCATLGLLRGRRVSTNHPAWPRQSGQPSPRGPRPSCGWGTTPTSGAAHASPGWIGRIRSALSSCWMTSRSRATWTGCKRGSETFLVP